MKQQQRAVPGLHPSLGAFPGVVLELSADGRILQSNGRMEALVHRPVTGVRLAALLDAVSAAKLERLLDAGTSGELPERCELIVATEQLLESWLFYPTRDATGPEPRLWLVQHPRDPAADQLNDQLTLSNAELIRFQRELSKKSAGLARALEELERKLAENEGLSQTLQYQNEEMEAQNEELLAMTEEMHRGQEDLLQLNQQLERRSRELQVALSARNRFYTAMSHELRTPINAVMGYNDLLLAGIYGTLNEQQELAVERSQRAVRHLRALINDVLDISKIEMGRMEMEVQEVELRGVLQSLFTALRPMAESQGSALLLDMEIATVHLATDVRCLRQILMNLLANAIRSGGGGPVMVSCAVSSSGGAVVEVTDSGDGVATDALAGVFEEFAHGGGVDSPLQGTGLGLAVARRLTALIGGMLDVSSAVGVGTVFRLTLPPALLLPSPPVIS